MLRLVSEHQKFKGPRIPHGPALGLRQWDRICRGTTYQPRRDPGLPVVVVQFCTTGNIFKDFNQQSSPPSPECATAFILILSQNLLCSPTASFFFFRVGKRKKSRSFSLSPFFPPHFCGRKPPALQHMAIQAIDCSFCFLRPIDPIFPGWPKVEISLANQVFGGRGKFFQNIPNLPLKRILGVGEKSW